jgi:hypothetical protein
VKAIGYLLRLRRSQRRAFGIDAATISRNCHDFRMLLEPFGEALGGSIGKKIHDAVQVQIDQNRSVVLAFAPSPIIDAQVANGKDRGLLLGLLPDTAQNGIVAGGDGQSLEESLTR